MVIRQIGLAWCVPCSSGKGADRCCNDARSMWRNVVSLLTEFVNIPFRVSVCRYPTIVLAKWLLGQPSTRRSARPQHMRLPCAVRSSSTLLGAESSEHESPVGYSQ